MALHEQLAIFIEYANRLKTEKDESDDLSEVVDKLRICNNIVGKILESSKPAKTAKVYKCGTCNETDPKYFNRKITECIQCMSKVAYDKMKPKIETGKQRNITERLKRVECCDCKLKVSHENAQMFDWDHRDPTEKEHNISRLNCKRDSVFYAEILKCDLVCRNCHAIRTKNQFKNNILQKKQPNKI